MSQKYAALTFREFFSFLDARAGRSYLIKKWKVENGTLIKWMSDPQYVDEDSVRQNPLEKFADTLTWCMEHGHVHESRAIVAALAELVNCALIPAEQIAVDRKCDIRDRMLDDTDSLGRFHSKIRKQAKPEAVQTSAIEAIDEIIRTVERYRTKYDIERYEQAKGSDNEFPEEFTSRPWWNSMKENDEKEAKRGRAQNTTGKGRLSAVGVNASAGYVEQ